jgi:hypothetical protein
VAARERRDARIRDAREALKEEYPSARNSDVTVALAL